MKIFAAITFLLIATSCVQTQKTITSEEEPQTISPYVVNTTATVDYYCKPCMEEPQSICYRIKMAKGKTWEEIPVSAVLGLNYKWGYTHQIGVDIIKEKRFAPRNSETYKVQKVNSTKKIDEEFQLKLSNDHIRYRQEVATTIPEFSFLKTTGQIVFDNTTIGHQFLEKFERGKLISAIYKVGNTPNELVFQRFIIE